MLGCRHFSRFVLALGFASSAGSGVARAGTDTHLQVVAASRDGRHIAVALNGDASGRWVCGLSKQHPALPLTAASLEVAAECGGSGPLLPFERWTWPRSTPEVRLLRKVEPPDPTNPFARIVVDPDTQVRRIEVVQQGAWYPVLADERSTVDEAAAEARYASPGLTRQGKFSEIRGVLRHGDGLVVAFSNTDAYGLIVVDDAIALSGREVLDVNGRGAGFRDNARERTKRLRQHYAERSGPFTQAAPSESSRARKRAAAARDVLKLWEQARVFGPLSSADLTDALWLLAWLPAPTRRQEAMRFYLELLDRDGPAAEAAIRALSADPATLALAIQLQTRYDPLRWLPAVSGCSFKRLSEADLKRLSNEELLWVHRAQWAAQGGYRFSDLQVQQYFEGFVWYAPIPKDVWRLRATKKLRDNPDAPLLKKVGASTPADACKENLQVILNAEHVRGLSAPSL